MPMPHTGSKDLEYGIHKQTAQPQTLAPFINNMIWGKLGNLPMLPILHLSNDSNDST